METNELIYRRKTRQTETPTGLLYLHVWKTGCQELVFPSKLAADAFAADETELGRPTVVRHGDAK